jgi:hypothetical protein
MDDDDELALLLVVTTRELTEAIGRLWRRERNLGTPDTDRIWFVGGEPMQVLLGIGFEDLVVGTPTLQWAITPHLAMDEEIARLPLTLNPQVVEAVTRAQEIRRAQFAFCRRCRRLTAPENGGSNCHGCMQQLDGVVF